MSWLYAVEKSSIPTLQSAFAAYKENPLAIQTLKMIAKVALSGEPFINWDVTIPELVGMTLYKIENMNDEELYLKTTEARTFKFYHSQDCCENVSIGEIIGDLDDLIGSPLVRVEERVENGGDAEKYESVTYTFYEFATIKGSVTIRWIGSSNGYYSESVDFMEVV